MPRYKLILEYCGTGFSGWQRQPDRVTVQEVLEEAVVRFCGEAVIVHGAGRTDAGVHASHQAAHIDLARPQVPDRIRGALNFHVRPHRVAVLEAEEVTPDFHARISAIGRRYCYRILNRRAPAALDTEFVWHIPVALDHDAMAAGAGRLLGHHDFTTFRDSLCQAKSPIKTLDLLEVTRHGDEIRIAAHARSFLHHQVRNMVGTLFLVGTGKWSPDDVAAALAARDRRKGGPTAPATGLSLVDVVYPEADRISR